METARAEETHTRGARVGSVRCLSPNWHTVGNVVLEHGGADHGRSAGAQVGDRNGAFSTCFAVMCGALCVMDV